MRFFVGFALLFAGVALIHGLPVGSQLNNLNALLAQLPQYQVLLGQLDNILPQLNGVLSSSQLQSLKDKIVQLILNQVGNKPDLNAIKDQVLAVLQQYIGSKPQGRIDVDVLLQQIAGTAASILPGLLLGMLGKRDVSGDARDLSQILALADKFQLNTILPQVQNLLSADKLQQLQNQFFNTVVTALGNNWNLATLSQALQQLVTQFIPQIGQMRIDWDAVGQAALNGVVTAIPGLLIGALSLFGKRDVSDDARDLSQILALADKFQLNTILPQVQNLLSADKLQQLQNQIFTTVVTALGNNWNLATLSQAIQQLVTQFVPQIGQMRIDWDAVGQAALNGVVTAIPGLLIGALSLFGKRDVSGDARDLSQILALVDKYQLNALLPEVENFLGPDKLQELQNQFFNTVVTALGNNWNLATLSQALQQLFTQFIPQIGQMRIDWDAVGQAALNGVVTAIPGLLMGALSLFGKRGLDINYQQLLSQLPVNEIAQLVQVVLNADKTQVLAKLKQLLQQFFPNLRGSLNFDELAANLLNHLNSLLPTLGQSIFGSIFG